MRRLVPALLAPLLLIPAGGPALADSEPSPASRSARPHGVDVSRWDPGFDWDRPGIDFGFAKATEDTDRVDPTFARNWAAMRERGIVRGAYHYGHPDSDPIEQADHFLATVASRGLGKGDLLVLDLEITEGESRAEINAWAKRWLEHVHKKTGTRPLFYSSWSFAGEHGQGLERYPLWVAHYDRSPGRVEAPEPWRTWYVHQYAAGPPHDVNVANVPVRDLKELGLQKPYKSTRSSR